MMTRHLAPKLDFHGKRLLLAAAWMALVGSVVIAQVSAAPDAAHAANKNAAGAKALAFDVVSIRPSAPGSVGRVSYGILPDGYHAKNQSLRATILMAYLPVPVWPTAIGFRMRRLG